MAADNPGVIAPTNLILPTITNGGVSQNQIFISGGGIYWISGAIVQKFTTTTV